jgi:hypothetical protein
MPVFVTVGILQVNDMIVREGPKISANASLGVVRYRFGRFEVADGRNPDVQHPVDRRQKAKPRSVRADARCGAVWVSEKDLARNHRYLFEVFRCAWLLVHSRSLLSWFCRGFWT